jgi:uncharacterized membrane protein YbhN (UPF0104 family)
MRWPFSGKASSVHRSWKMWVGFAISAVAIAALLWNMRFRELFLAISNARAIWFLPAIVLFAATFLARSWRWSVLMSNAPFWTTVHALTVGYMLNSTLPFRLGEVARAYVIGQRTSVSATRAFSAVIVERVIDLASVIAMFAAFAQWVPMPPSFSHAATAGGLIVVLLLAVGFLVVWKAGAVEKRLPKALLPKFREVTESFRVVGGARMLVVLAQTALIWALTILLAFATILAFFPGTLEEAGLVVVTANLGGALPSAPGGLGIVQSFAKVALVVPFHVGEEEALAFVLVWSLAQQLLLAVMGVVSLARLGMSFSEVRHEVADRLILK